MRNKKITIKEVAAEAGVSIATVSRVLNGEASVALDLRDRVEKAIRFLNYIPNVNARNIRSKDLGLIGVIVPDVGDNFFSNILEGIIEGAEKLGKGVLTFSCHGKIGREWKCLEQAAQAGVSALIYCPQGEVEAKDLYQLFPQDLPLVILYRRNIIAQAPHIYHNNVKAGYIASKYLLIQGRTRIAFIASAWGNPFKHADDLIQALDGARAGAFSAIDRLKGYRQALAEFAIPFDKELVWLSDFGYENGYQSGKRLLASLVDFDAVIAGNDVLAAGVMQALSEQNIKIPEKVSIIGCDDSIHAKIAIPNLTSVKQRPLHIGRESIRMLAEVWQGKKVQDYVVDVELIVRDSTSQKPEN